jgi:murein DD-endopeptidase MepM/ murein hydrolase activator NlpD
MAVATRPKTHAPASQPYSGPYASLINRSAQRNGIDAWLLAALLYVESGFNPHAVSKTGDHGIAQINLASHPSVTAAEAADPSFAIPWAARYLAELKKHTGSTKGALRAYNTGSGDVSAAGSRYANKILGVRAQALRTARAAPAGGLTGYAGVDQGVDFTGKGAIPAIAAGRITDVGTETDLEGQHGRYVIERLGNGEYVYVAENFTPTVRRGQIVKAGQKIGVNLGVTSQGTGIEIGLNRTPQGWSPVAPLSSTDPHGPTPAGEAMLAFLKKRGAKVPSAGGAVSGSPASLKGFFDHFPTPTNPLAPLFGGTVSPPSLGGVVGGVKSAYDTTKSVGELAGRILTDPGYIFLWVGFAIVGLAFIFLGVERLLGRSVSADAGRAATLVAAPEAATVGVAG